MKLRVVVSLLLLVPLILTGCGYLFLRDIKCRDFKVGNIQYFPGSKGDTVTFLSGKGGEKKFVLNRKDIFHTTNYVTDTGCRCHDIIQIIYTSGNDSIWYRHDLTYIYDRKEREYFAVSFSLDSVRTQFDETRQDSTSTEVSLGGTNYRNVRKYVTQDLADSEWIREVYIAEDFGLIGFERGYGEFWMLQSPTATKVKMESFEVKESPCI